MGANMRATAALIISAVLDRATLKAMLAVKSR
jgi:hypothetical protein